jgi:hypothetical protein
VAYLKPIASVLFFTTLCDILGVAATADAGRGSWSGAVVGGIVGSYFGLIFGGATTGEKLLDVIYSPGDDRESAEL